MDMYHPNESTHTYSYIISDQILGLVNNYL